jgi:hypothetical protein
MIDVARAISAQDESPAEARKRASLSRNAISARLRLVMSRPVPQYPVNVPASSYTGSPLMQ